MKEHHLPEILRNLAALPPEARNAELARLAKHELSRFQTLADAAKEEDFAPWVEEAVSAATVFRHSTSRDTESLKKLAEDLVMASATPGPSMLPDADEIRRRVRSILEQPAGVDLPEGPPLRSEKLDLARVRFRGDAQDIEELHQTYRIGDYIAAFEQNLRQQETSARARFLAEGVRLTESLSPRIYGIFARVCEALGIHRGKPEIFCLRSQEINAFAVISHSKDGAPSTCIGVTAAALEMLDDPELAFLLGHELAHFLFDNNRLNALLAMDKSNPAVSVLPPLGESIFLRWRKKAEISADRIGLLAAGDFASAARALLKAAFGLSERNLNLDIDALLAQIDELAGRPQLMEAKFAAHPLLAIRLKALSLFAISEKARDAGYPAQGDLFSDDALAAEIERLLDLTRRHPRAKRDVAAMEVVALGGVAVLSADGEISEDEIKILIEILHRHFTDYPEEVIPISSDNIEPRLTQAIDSVNETDDPELRNFIIGRLAEIALADGALLGEEGATIIELASRLGLSTRSAYRIMVGAAQAMGFRVDAKLNRVAESLRESLRLGLG